MKQHRFVVDGLLSIQFILLIITGITEHHPAPSVHMILGIAFAGTFGVHLFLQRRWFGSVLRGYAKIPAPVRTNVYLAAVLIILFCINFISGLSGALAEVEDLVHVHVLTAWLAVAGHAIHLFRHRKWVRRMSLQRMPG